ncbi:putative hydrolase [Clostridium collagenovorans DSM 3089]|uniref:Putative hydrolase n=1 Tax=Clostridium collagenovorans DSM 3089 TaxID=1121306 RepID=A0A1M5WYE7_9CLOT|nr:phosphatase [Clostridium collagenovorans]SHH92530.1 putative hydrolase [Clostridium collagenovorans DSM 3089]
MERFSVDLHTHSIVSGHAYNTLFENLDYCAKNDIRVLGSTEHGPSMPGAPHYYYFSNMRILPRVVNGVILLRGCEANIIDRDGNLDIQPWLQEGLDYVIASFHEPCIKPGNIDENTETILKVMENPYVDIIGHSGNPAFPIHLEEFVKKAKEKNKIIELNNSSFVTSRAGSEKNCIKIAKLCKEYGVRVVANSDAHYCGQIGKFDAVREVLKEIAMPEELIINTDYKEILRYLKAKGKLPELTILKHSVKFNKE